MRAGYPAPAVDRRAVSRSLRSGPRLALQPVAGIPNTHDDPANRRAAPSGAPRRCLARFACVSVQVVRLFVKRMLARFLILSVQLYASDSKNHTGLRQVEMRGLEPLTSALQRRRSPN